MWSRAKQDITGKRGWGLASTDQHGSFDNPKPENLQVVIHFMRGADRSFNSPAEGFTAIVDEAVLEQDPLAIEALILLTTHNPTDYGAWKETAEALRQFHETQKDPATPE